MKKKDVKVGGTYRAKVTDKVVSVRLDAENPHGGWDGTNLTTGKKVRIKSAQRLRGPAGQKGKGSKTEPEPVEAALPETETDRPAAKPDTTTKQPKKDKPKRTSALDAAAEVLKTSDAPMRAKEMIEAMAARGLWSSPNGRTPEATLYSAITREINTKGTASRFRKTERGLFVRHP